MSSAFRHYHQRPIGKFIDPQLLGADEQFAFAVRTDFVP
jgi:hypothetical protein